MIQNKHRQCLVCCAGWQIDHFSRGDPCPEKHDFGFGVLIVMQTIRHQRKMDVLTALDNFSRHARHHSTVHGSNPSWVICSVCHSTNLLPAVRHVLVHKYGNYSKTDGNGRAAERFYAESFQQKYSASFYIRGHCKKNKRIRKVASW